ncbi:MAG: DUF2259 domain-containing protein [Pseudomonadota bacterium]
MKYIVHLIMKNRLFLSIAILLTSLGLSQAGDFAKREIHGFSFDGGLFAFEEYGVQDGSGFAYANIYVINTATDQWTAGSPFRVLLKDDTKSVFDAREEARIMAGPVMKSFEGRGNVVATNRSTEKGIDSKRMVANPRFVVPPIDEEIEYRITKKSFIASELCAPFGPAIGFKLTQIATGPSQSSRILHEDQSVPKSRNCPRDYDFADLVTYYPTNASPKVAIIILMTTQGFEGPDGRFLAITASIGP